MAKFYGEIGYSETSDSSNGVWTETITERKYYGDVIRNAKRWQAGEHLNDNLVVDNEISIIADPFAYENFHTMRYIKWMGALWKIIKITIQRPRIILSIGEVYNGPIATPDDVGGDTGDE